MTVSTLKVGERVMKNGCSEGNVCDFDVTCTLLRGELNYCVTYQGYTNLTWNYLLTILHHVFF